MDPFVIGVLVVLLFVGISVGGVFLRRWARRAGEQAATKLFSKSVTKNLDKALTTLGTGLVLDTGLGTARELVRVFAETSPKRYLPQPDGGYAIRLTGPDDILIEVSEAEGRPQLRVASFRDSNGFPSAFAEWHLFKSAIRTAAENAGIAVSDTPVRAFDRREQVTADSARWLPS